MAKHEGQPALLEMQEQPEGKRRAVPVEVPKLVPVDRKQMRWTSVAVEDLIAGDHKARAIWELAGKMDLTRFTESLRTHEGSAGRPAWDPQVLVSVWVYSYSEGISSARQIERMMEWEPGLKWLTGMEEINHHTLSDFRVRHKASLDELFAKLLAMLESEGLLDLGQVMHDGTKIRAYGGADTFRRKPTLERHLETARELVAQMGDPRADGCEADQRRSRQQAAQERAARERQQRLEHALREMEALQQQVEKPDQVRASMTEPEARLMKHGDHAILPSYNAQISTDSKNKIIVGVHLSQCSSDAQSLEPAVEQVQENLGRKPEQVVADGGFTNRDNIRYCAGQNIDLIGSLPDPAERSAAAMKSAGIDPAFAPQHFCREEGGRTLLCPAGKRLAYKRQSTKRENVYQQYQASGEDCSRCGFQKQCCPKHAGQGRTVSLLEREQADVAAFRRKMEQPEARAVYRKRGEVAEFPNAWLKDKLNLRKFRVRGLAKAGIEIVWAALTYNVMQWIRLCWRSGQKVEAGA